MLFIGFKYKLIMTTRLGPFILLTQHNTTSLVLDLGCTALENCQQSVLLVTKATTIAYKT